MSRFAAPIAVLLMVLALLAGYQLGHAHAQRAIAAACQRINTFDAEGAVFACTQLPIRRREPS